MHVQTCYVCTCSMYVDLIARLLTVQAMVSVVLVALADALM